MRNVFALLIFVVILSGCKKDSAITTTTVQVKVVHKTCVQVVLKTLNNNTIGENWMDGFRTIHTNCFNLSSNSNLKIDSLNQVFTVDILSTGTPFQGICLMADIAGTSKCYDIVEQ